MTLPATVQQEVMWRLVWAAAACMPLHNNGLLLLCISGDAAYSHLHVGVVYSCFQSAFWHQVRELCMCCVGSHVFSPGTHASGTAAMQVVACGARSPPCLAHHCFAVTVIRRWRRQCSAFGRWVGVLASCVPIVVSEAYVCVCGVFGVCRRSAIRLQHWPPSLQSVGFPLTLCTCMLLV